LIPSLAGKKSSPRAVVVIVAQWSNRKAASSRVFAIPEPAPGAMSRTRVVVTPLLAQSSRPEEPSSAEKKTRLPNRVSRSGFEWPAGLMSATSTVPASVPSVFHSS
jgi:hypothetical protein